MKKETRNMIGGRVLRKYLNSDSRLYVSMSFAMVGALEEQEKYIEKSQIDKSEKEKLKNLRMAMTYLKKYCSTWIDDLDYKERDKIARLVETSGFLYQDKYKARLQVKKWDNALKNSTIEVHQDYIEDLLDLVVRLEGACKGCNKDKKQVEKCKVREALERYDASATCENPSVCKYEL